MTVMNKKQYVAPGIRVVALHHHPRLMTGSGEKPLMMKKSYDDDVTDGDEASQTKYDLGW